MYLDVVSNGTYEEERPKKETVFMWIYNNGIYREHIEPLIQNKQAVHK